MALIMGYLWLGTFKRYLQGLLGFAFCDFHRVCSVPDQCNECNGARHKAPVGPRFVTQEHLVAFLGLYGVHRSGVLSHA